MEPNLFNLVEFDLGILRTSTSLLSRAMSRRERAYAFLENVAAYFWLLFGLDAEYFPEGHAQSLFAQRFMALSSEFEQLYSAWGYFFDPEFGPLMRGAYNLKRPVQRDEDLRVYRDPIAHGAIRDALMAEGQLLRSREARLFAGLLNFDADLLRQVLKEGEARGSPTEGPIERDAIVSGFQDVVSYMRGHVELSRTLQQEGTIIGRRCDFRIRQITRWRVNRHHGIDGPFTDVARFVNKQYLGGAYSDSQLTSDITDLLEDWGFTHLKQMRTGSGGN